MVHFAEEPLAQYKVVFERDQKALQTITEPRLFDTQFRSPQRVLWESGADDWHLVMRLSDYAPRRRSPAPGRPLPLFPAEPASESH